MASRARNPVGLARRAYVKLKRWLHRFAVRSHSWLLNFWGQRRYRRLSEAELRATRKSDTVFIFGSGYSINDISAAEWQHFEQHDTVSFNMFVHQDFVRADYEVIREMGNRFDSPSLYMPEVNELLGLVRQNRRYAGAVLVVQGGWGAVAGNQVVGRGLLPPRNPLFRYRNRRWRGYGPPAESFAEGLAHGPSTLVDCVNFAYVLGWRRIVLVGVDLYDRRYFWLPADETREFDQRRNASHDQRHNAADGLVSFLGPWREHLAIRDVEIYVYNPRSLLTQVLPVYEAGIPAAGSRPGPPGATS